MARRDDWRKVMMSDWFSIEIDSYHDHQTAFEFLVNSMGVQFDDMVFDDISRNSEWNAVWESEVSSDEGGWNVEMRIPFSVLRFSDDAEITMGINLNRYIQRKNELMSWVVFPRGQAGIASKFGHLEGIVRLKGNQNSMSIKPYLILGNYRFNNYKLIDPFKENHGIKNVKDSGVENKIGLDFKYLIAQDIIADIVLNPDYGQIEADPAEINLTYFETYFTEKRTFFIENATLFDTPIDVFYSRRIGANRDYVMGNRSAPQNSRVKYAGKISGKTKRGLSFGIISAVTNDSTNSWQEFKTNSNFLIGRVTQDLFGGNSYIGFLSTIYNDSQMTHYVNSVDMLSYLWDGQLVMDWQLINSQTDKSGNGLSFEMNYNPTKSSLYSWIDFEYFDKAFDINNVGYLYRNNLKKAQGGIGFYWPELNIFLPIMEGKVNVNFNKKTNIDNLILNNSVGISTATTFNNLWHFSVGYNYFNEHYDDFLIYNYYYKSNDYVKEKIGPPVNLPGGYSSELYLGNNPNQYYSFSYYKSIWENDFEKGSSNGLSLNIKIGKNLDIYIEYQQANSYDLYRWIEILNGDEYVFTNSNNINHNYSYQIDYSINRKINVQLYLEFYTNFNYFNDFYTYDSQIDKFHIDNNLYEGTINPQNRVDYLSKDQMLNLNMVLNYEFRPGSNVYVVYSIYRDVVGKKMGSFSEFLKYVPSNTDLSEVNFTQSLFFKMDYWFDF